MNKKVASRTKISIAVSVALGAGLMGAGFAPFALAQQAGDVQRVEITGSRLPSLNLEGVSPVTTLSAQDIKFDGGGKVEDLLRNLPSVADSQSAYLSNGSVGTAQVNLRGLGADRNLVLVNGRRLPPGSPTQGGYAADLNQVPVGLIQRVEVLTGGASGVYGSDAMSGVVNFIMNDKFEGLQINLNHSFYNHQQGNAVSGIVAARAVGNPTAFVVPGDVASDGDVHNVSVLLGGNFASGRGNATLYFDYKKEDGILQANRDFSACALAAAGATFTCAGSSANTTGRFLTNVADLTVADAAGNVRPYRTATDAFNFAPYNYFRRPDEKYSFGAFAHYDLFRDLRVYAELGFHSDRTASQIAPSGLFAFFDASGPNAIRFGNPFLSPAWVAALQASNAAVGLPFAAPGDTADILLARRNVEGGGRQDDIRHTSFRYVFGMKGEVLQHWNYDVSMQMGRVEMSRVYKNDLSTVRTGRALNAVTDPATGLPTCQSVLDRTDANCAPYDLWRLGGPTAAALNYMSVPLVARGHTQQQIISTNFNADLGNYGIRLPAAKNGVAVSFGIESRKEQQSLEPDQGFTTGDGAGQSGATPAVAGKTSVGEYFGEVRVPLIEKRAMADLLQVNANYRHSTYRKDQKTNTYGMGLEWAPVSAYRLRGGYNRAVRAPNIQELFLAPSGNLFDLTEDPCGATAVAGGTAATAAQCARTGVTAAQYGTAILDSPAGQYNFTQGGNQNLRPEKADTYTAGLVFQPTRNLSGSIDYWSIKLDGFISNAPPDVILTQCLQNNQFCNLITRDRLGTLWALTPGRIVALDDNLGGLATKGWDFAVNYNHRLGSYGSLGINFIGTLLTKWEYEAIKGLGKFDCVGLIGPSCGSPNPKWRHKARATWTTPWNVELAFTWRHIDKVLNEGTDGNPLLNGTVAASERELKKRDYLDIAGSWRINKTFSLTGGVNNITDKDPPIVGGLSGPATNGNGNTFPGVYDTLGRLVFMNLQAKF